MAPRPFPSTGHSAPLVTLGRGDERLSCRPPCLRPWTVCLNGALGTTRHSRPGRGPQLGTGKQRRAQARKSSDTRFAPLVNDLSILFGGAFDVQGGGVPDNPAPQVQMPVRSPFVARPVALANWQIGRVPTSVTASIAPLRKREVSVQSGQISQSKGLVSIDRSMAAALPSTTPRQCARSSTNDLAPLHRTGSISFRHTDATVGVREEPFTVA